MKLHLFIIGPYLALWYDPQSWGVLARPSLFKDLSEGMQEGRALETLGSGSRITQAVDVGRPSTKIGTGANPSKELPANKDFLFGHPQPKTSGISPDKPPDLTAFEKASPKLGVMQGLRQWAARVFAWGKRTGGKLSTGGSIYRRLKVIFVKLLSRPAKISFADELSRVLGENIQGFIDVNAIETRILKNSNNPTLRQAVTLYKNSDKITQISQIDAVLSVVRNSGTSPQERDLAMEALCFMADPSPPHVPPTEALVKIRYALMDFKWSRFSSDSPLAENLDLYLKNRALAITDQQKFVQKLKSIPWGQELFAPREAVARFDDWRYLDFPQSIDKFEHLAPYRNIETLKPLAQEARVQAIGEIISTKSVNPLPPATSVSTLEQTASLDFLYWIATTPSPRKMITSQSRMLAMSHIWSISGKPAKELPNLMLSSSSIRPFTVEQHLRDLAGTMMSSLDKKAGAHIQDNALRLLEAQRGSRP